MTMRTRIIEGTSSVHVDLWVQWPDHIDVLGMVWIVHGHPDTVDGRTTTIPVPLKNLPDLIKVLNSILSKE